MVDQGSRDSPFLPWKMVFGDKALFTPNVNVKKRYVDGQKWVCNPFCPSQFPSKRSKVPPVNVTLLCLVWMSLKGEWENMIEVQIVVFFYLNNNFGNMMNRRWDFKPKSSSLLSMLPGLTICKTRGVWWDFCPGPASSCFIIPTLPIQRRNKTFISTQRLTSNITSLRHNSLLSLLEL